MTSLEVNWNDIVIDNAYEGENTNITNTPIDGMVIT